MRGLYVPLPEAALEELRELAAQELRGTKDQAAWLIFEGLQRAGRERQPEPGASAERDLVGADR